MMQNKLNPTIQYKKSSLSNNKKQRQSLMKKSYQLKSLQKNNTHNIQMDFLQIKGTQRQLQTHNSNQLQQQLLNIQLQSNNKYQSNNNKYQSNNNKYQANNNKYQQSNNKYEQHNNKYEQNNRQQQNNRQLPNRIHKQSNNQLIVNIIQKQFIQLKQKIILYCTKLNHNFIQHSKIQHIIQQSQSSYNITQLQLFNLFINRIKSFIYQNNLKQLNKQQNKLSIPLQSSHSNSHSINIQPLYIDQGHSVQTEKIQHISVLNLQNKNKLNKQTINNFNDQSKQHPKHHYTHQKFYSTNFISSIPIACSSSISQILYKQAHLKAFPQFHVYCQKILLSKQPVISDFHFFKKQKLQKTNFYLSQIYKKLNLMNTKLSFSATGDMNFMKKQQKHSNGQDKIKNLGQQIDQICIVLKKLNQLHNLNSLIFDCSRPCCKFQQKHLAVSTKAKILLNLKQAAKKSIHYKTQITDEYFNRYYNKDSFDRTRIYSLSKTKTQQMQQLQKTYQKNKDNQKQCKKRCHSLFQNINSCC